MAKRRAKWQRGKFTDRSEPIWEPLLELLPEDIDDFMWMGEAALTDGTHVQFYKHYWTRRYLLLDLGGRIFFCPGEDRYAETEDLEQMLRVVFAGRESRDQIISHGRWVESDDVQWAGSATKHRISQRQSLHVIRHAGICFEEVEWPRQDFAEPDARLAFFGDDEDGRELEVIAVGLEGGGLLVVHAMALRAKYGLDHAEALGWRK